jgi:hypothetical protein
MPEAFIETLHSWQNFYFMSGGAAATLLGLMFIAVSLGIHLVSEQNREKVKHFVEPSIFYFVSALLLAGTMLVPVYTPPGLALVLFAGGAFGLSRTITFVRPLIQPARKYQDFDIPEWLAQIIMPPLAYVLMILAACCLIIDQWSIAFMSLFLAILLLLVSAISNTWSLVLWIVDQRQE